jgi:hypothetical protein
MQERSSPLWRLVERVYGGRGEESACVDTVVRVGGGGDASGVKGWEPVGRYWDHARVKEMSAIRKYMWAKSKKGETY